VGTVDSFQGQERDIIAITLTRSNPQGEIGFLSDIRRMNVGMTRARRKLLLVGNSPTLCRHPFFWELLTYVKGWGATAQSVRWANIFESLPHIVVKRAREFVLNGLHIDMGLHWTPCPNDSQLKAVCGPAAPLRDLQLPTLSRH
jgi:hypothetical protein